MKTFYYASIIKNICKALTNLFDDLKVQRYDENGTLVKQINVPITLGPVDKFWLSRKKIETDKEYYLKLPRIALELTGITYDGERATSVNTIREWWNTSLNLSEIDSFFTDPVPTPENYNFTLKIRTEYMEDFVQLTEQILPYFNSKLYLRIKEFSFLNVERDLPVTLNSFNIEYLDEQTTENHRYINGTLDLTIEGYMYFPITTDASIIRQIDTHFFVDNIDGTSAVEESFWSISGVEVTSAGTLDVSAIPAYNFSGYSAENNYYYFTSTVGYDV